MNIHESSVRISQEDLQEQAKYNWTRESEATMSATQIQTPQKGSRLSSFPNKRGIEVMDVDSSDLISTIVADANEHHESELDREHKFDVIATNVNKTIHELNAIYNLIGYSTQEIESKKSEIFSHIEETISNFTASLQREKSSIENETEWLRQQIRIILAMINDNKGDKSLSLLERGLVFNDSHLYEEGYKEEVLRKLSQIQQRKQSFYVTSPFNESTLRDEQDNELNYEQQYDYMLKNIPHLSLMQLKSKLNSIFLEVLKVFVQLLKKLNELNLEYVNKMEIIGDFRSPDANVQIISALPSKEDAEQHRILIGNFESTIRELNLEKNSKTLPGRSGSQNTFIVSSPRKARKEYESTNIEASPPRPQETSDSQINYLRDINYQIVRVIRGLKFTKITPDILSTIQKEIDSCNLELQARSEKLNQIIETCFELINSLHLGDDQIMDIQKSFEIRNSGEATSNDNDGYFDVDTLKFIQADPTQFGLNDAHITYLERFSQVLQKIKDSKQQKWDQYVSSCKSLWEKLGENSEYTENFLRANSGLTDISLMNLKLELNKLYMKRSEFIDSFIADTRIEIEKLWDVLFYSKEQRIEFPYYHYDARNDETDKELVLSEHEQELALLQEEYKAKEPVLSYYDQLNDLIQDQVFLRESSKDSSRLLSKNSCKILLHEEKIRKKINKNMPKLLETIKAEVVKYNNKAIQEGKKPLMVNGEDFFEKLLLVESEQANQANKRPAVNRQRKTTSSESPPQPVKGRAATISPVKRGRSPTSMSARYGTRTSKAAAVPSRRTSPLKSTAGPEGSVKKTVVPVRTHRTLSEKTYNNPTTIRLTNAINSSIGSHTSSRSTLDSPIQFTSRESPTKFVAAHLQPLNTPLIANSFSNNQNPEIYEDTIIDSTHQMNFSNQHMNLSNISRGSPLKLNGSLGNGVSLLSSKSRFSPVREVQLQKENSSPYEFSPIKLSMKNSFLSSRDSIPTVPSSRRRISVTTCDSSTLVGDDYQTWRDEKIKQINGLD
ncbi:microtubule associated protein-domain-containing protein [Scheffersomyces xylosifermentans]|uniref:microtubule associated protein-domain-containing protein n=1 Tax=Scheffersomyces xylosifermentans TaxID=1304137 RepID=UPI00315DD105